MLDDIGQFKLRDIGELTLWEQVMPYAIAFGLAKKVLKQLKLEFSEEIAADPYWTYYYAGASYGAFASSLMRRFLLQLAQAATSRPPAPPAAVLGAAAAAVLLICFFW